MKYLFSFVTLVGSAFGICGAASPTWTCPLDANGVSVRNLLNGTQAGVTRNDTISVGAGTITMTSAWPVTKGVKLIGAGAGSSIITLSGTQLFDAVPDATAIANSTLVPPYTGADIIQLTGFTLNGNNVQDQFLTLEGASGISGTKPFCCYVITGNTFKNGSASSTQGVITAANGNGNGELRGVISGNTFDRTNVYLRVFSNNDTGEAANTAFNGPMKFDGTGLGAADELFFETNNIQFSSSYAGNNPGWSETGQGGRLVQRYNTFDFTNVTTPQELNDVHGFQGWPGGNTGTVASERYGNSYANFNGFRCVDYRGGVGMIFDNIFTASGSGCDLEVYGESATNFCPSSISPSPTNYNPLIYLYGFDNTVKGIEKPFINGFGGSFSCTIAENNGNALSTVGASSQGSWWNLDTTHCTSSACTQGIGRGTTTPVGTCTKGTGYWVASTPTPTTSSSVIQSAQFYVCTATNTWTQFYTPYTYPHPLLATAPAIIPSLTMSGAATMSGSAVIQ